MLQIKFIMSLMLILQTQSESRTVSTKIKRIVAQRNENPTSNINLSIKNSEVPKKCDELSTGMLNDILGAAYNSRCVFVCA